MWIHSAVNDSFLRAHVTPCGNGDDRESCSARETEQVIAWFCQIHPALTHSSSFSHRTQCRLHLGREQCSLLGDHELCNVADLVRAQADALQKENITKNNMTPFKIV